MAALALSIEFGEPFLCANCGVPMVIAKSISNERAETGGSVYCPNGHSLSWAGSLKQKLAASEKALAAERARASMAENSCTMKTRELSDLHKRIKNGVCPCCKRSFTNLRRHMTTKHPDHAT